MVNKTVNTICQAATFVLTILWAVWTYLYWKHEPFYAANKNLVDWMEVVLMFNFCLVGTSLLVSWVIGKNLKFSTLC